MKVRSPKSEVATARPPGHEDPDTAGSISRLEAMLPVLTAGLGSKDFLGGVFHGADQLGRLNHPRITAPAQDPAFDLTQAR